MGDQPLKTEIHDAMTAALRAGDKVRLGALRLLLAAIKTKEVEGSAARELSDDEVREVAAKEVKKRTESIEAFDAAGRTELAARERLERDVILTYAPEPLSDDAVDALIDEAIESTGASSEREIGKVMGVVMGAARGRVDGGLVRQRVAARLADSKQQSADG